MVAPRQLDVIRGPARAPAKLGEVEPYDARRHPTGVHLTSFDLQTLRCFTRPVRHRDETGLLRLLRGCIQGVMIDPGARERSQPIVRVAIELDQLEMRLD